MIRNFKLLGLAAVAALALSGFIASAAVAVPQYTASSYPSTFTASNTKGGESTTTEAGTTQCDSHFQGSLSAAGSTLTIAPKYTNCESFGFLSATYNVEECTYVFHATEQRAAGLYAHHMDVACPAGQSIKITAGTCKSEIKPQTGLTTVETTNLAGGTVTWVWKVTNMALTVTQDGFGCAFLGTGQKTISYHGDVLFSRVGGGSFSVSGS